MNYPILLFRFPRICRYLVYCSVFLAPVFSCSDQPRVDVTEKEIVEKPEEINEKAEDLIKGTLSAILSESRDLPDSFRIKNPEILYSLYDQRSFQPIWSEKGQFTPYSDSLFQFIDHSMNWGFFPEDYYRQRLLGLKDQLGGDTSQNKENKLNVSLWAYSDMLMTSAFVQLVKDLKAGRLIPDSIMAKDTSLNHGFFMNQLQSFQQRSNEAFAQILEPKIRDYHHMKLALQRFVDSADFRNYTLIQTKDSSEIPVLTYKRLVEEDTTLRERSNPDSFQVAAAIKKYQKRKGLKQDGKISKALINRLNNTDKEKFIRVAISLDKYKMLPAMPEKYLWVNIPSYYLQLRECDTVILQSKVVVGKPETKTPMLTSTIVDMITYPKWTIPESIIKKEILPGLKKDPGYTTRKGYSLVDKDGNEVDPYSVSWAKYEKGIPYKVVQGSGDDNALGVLKFNFPNKYSVYLHDTNQRYLFSKTSRALSHGCVRVQAWNELAQYILRNDSSFASNAVPVDSLESWLATKQKRYIPVRKPIPLFIRYFSCETKNGKLVFYEDIYEEDKRLRDRLFSSK
jgi:murein L,D-transpeptidase YcbB/YkuD